MTWYNKLWNIAKDITQKAAIAYTGYQVGDAKNDAEKITSALMQAQINQKSHENAENSIIENIVYGLVTITIVFIIIAIGCYIRFLLKRAVQRDRRLRNNINMNERNAANCQENA